MTRGLRKLNDLGRAVSLLLCFLGSLDDVPTRSNLNCFHTILNHPLTHDSIAPTTNHGPGV